MRLLTVRGSLCALLLASCAPVRATVRPPPVQFIENDYRRALAEARARNVPLFVDAWALWCHTCLSMRAFVFPDERLRPVASRFVWSSIDIDRDANADVVAKLEVRVLPTLFVIDSRDERVMLAWPGSLTAPELAELLDDARDGAQPTGPLAVDASVTRAKRDGKLHECAALAEKEMQRMPPGTALADVIRTGMECAQAQLEDPVERGRLAVLAPVAERVAADRSQPILADDRSDLYSYAFEAYRALDRPDEQARVAPAWAALLDDQAARAPTPAARAVFDAHRLQAYLALGQPQRAVPALEQSEHDFPGDYDPPARLAVAYLAMKRYPDALAASDRSLARGYGPRKLRLWSLRADVLVAMGDVEGARASLRSALDFAQSARLPESYAPQVSSIAKRLADLR